MKKQILILYMAGIIIGLCLIGSAWSEEKTPVAKEHLPIEVPIVPQKPLVQMAILLDTSGSMSGLIDQARTELWAIVNEFIFANRNGQQPELHVALYEYGKSSLAQKDGYIRQIVPFTTDLDKVSEELFALKTNGGSEYCGWVIGEATEELKWSSKPEDLKVIFIAGNEPFTQGPIDYRQTCKDAISKGIIINTIHCGSDGDGVNGKWKDGAVLADGKYLNINQNRKTIHIAAPQDKEITELGIKLNETYIAYGLKGDIAYQRQSAQDKNASTASEEVGIQRAVAKSSLHYMNESWDLVDALKTKKVKLEDVKDSELPEEMQKMSQEQREAFIKENSAKRTEIQNKIQRLNEERKKYVAEEMKKISNKTDTLGSAIIQAIRKQAEKKNFKFESKEKTEEKSEEEVSK